MSNELQCGHWCVYRCGQLCGIPLRGEEILAILPPRSKGHSLAQLRDALQSLGLQSEGRWETIDSFLAGDFPCIVHLQNPDHFVVAYLRNGSTIYIFDGAGARKEVPVSDFQSRWTGHTLRVCRSSFDSPLPAFQSRNVQGSCIQFDTIYQDAGTVPQGTRSVRLSYKFTNAGRMPLTIKRVYTDCRCLTAQQPDHPIAPGDRGEIVLEYVTGQRESFTHQAVVETDDAAYPRIPLTACGSTNIRVEATPTLVDFGSVAVGSTGVSYVFVGFRGGGVGSTIDSLSCSLESVSCRVVAPRDMLPERLLEGIKPVAHSGSLNLRSDVVKIIELKWTPTIQMPIGQRLAGMLTFTANNSATNKCRVPIVGTVSPPIEARPEVADFGDLLPNSVVHSQFALVPTAGQKIQILCIEPPIAGLTIASAVDTGGVVNVKLSSDSTVVGKLHKTTIFILVRINNSDVYKIPIKIFGWSRKQ
ncbi:DUF1573 domain-containing protein [Gemmata sp. JC717]|uniref:DUF1573 domain-containing protein n=1 Tax=Gemmata algarum TaxID=2975278 RepID=UPI0021BAC6D6|nr:DUF1573 domain-containing protein [Gemmata algarum]MDY3554882.1 DUF1573 domain-containing protein [Gemmata algarum]